MKVLAINGSPRKNGNTAFLLHEALVPLREAGWEVGNCTVGRQEDSGLPWLRKMCGTQKRALRF
ncbi:NAD(P)H-dependent oxidoreductase [Desulfovibrio sp. QI0430]